MVSTDSQSCFPRLDDFHLHTKCNVLKVSCLLDSIVLEVSFWSRVDWFSIILFFILFRLFACFVFFVCTVFCCDYCYLVMVITGHCNFFWTPASMHCIFSWSWSYSPKGAFRGAGWGLHTSAEEEFSSPPCSRSCTPLYLEVFFTTPEL